MALKLGSYELEEDLLPGHLNIVNSAFELARNPLELFRPDRNDLFKNRSIVAVRKTLSQPLFHRNRQLFHISFKTKIFCQPFETKILSLHFRGESLIFPTEGRGGRDDVIGQFS